MSQSHRMAKRNARVLFVGLFVAIAVSAPRTAVAQSDCKIIKCPFIGEFFCFLPGCGCGYVNACRYQCGGIIQILQGACCECA